MGRGMLQRHSLSMAAGFQPVPNNADAVIRSRAMSAEEQERDERMRNLLYKGTMGAPEESMQYRLEDAKAYADKIASQID